MRPVIANLNYAPDIPHGRLTCLRVRHGDRQADEPIRLAMLKELFEAASTVASCARS